MAPQKVLWRPSRPKNLSRHHKEAQKWKFMLTPILIQISEKHGAGRVRIAIVVGPFNAKILKKIIFEVFFSLSWNEDKLKVYNDTKCTCRFR